MRLKLFEIESEVTWWVASADELGVLSLIRDEMYNRDYTDAEVDSMLTEFEVREIDRCEAEEIGIASAYDGDIMSLWYAFSANKREGVLGCSLDQDAVDLSGTEELNFDDDEF